MQSEKKKLMFCAYIVLIAAYLITLSEGANPSVTLTVEEGRSLLGEHCPGTVRILCYGVDLSVLRWRFNGSTDIVTFFSNNVAPTPFTTNPAFLNAELLSASQDPVDPNFSTFLSELMVDVSKLETESITSITCGDPDTFKMIPVDVEIIQQTELESPNETNVTALYEFGSLTDVIVSWKKLKTRCPEFQISLVYHITLLGSNVVSVNHTSCGEVCIVNFRSFSDASEEYRVSLYAVNAIGTSESVEYPITIVKQSSSYFIPTILPSDCLFTFECFSNGSLDTDSCDVLYATDSMYLDPTMIVSPLNTRFEITGITFDTLYYFDFSVSVNHTLLVRNRLTEQAVSNPTLSVLVIVFLTLTSLAILVGIVFGIIVLCVVKKWNEFPANILLYGAFILGTLSLIILIIFSIIGSQGYTCSLDWCRARNALTISAFLLAVFGNVLLTCFLFASCRKKKSGKIDLPELEHSPVIPRCQVDMHKCDHADTLIDYQKKDSGRQTNGQLIEFEYLQDSRVTSLSNETRSDSSPGDFIPDQPNSACPSEENKAVTYTTSGTNNKKTHPLNGKHKSKQSRSEDTITGGSAPSSSPDISSGQMDTIAMSYLDEPKADANKCSQTKQGTKAYTVYKVVVRLEHRSYFLFKRYSDFNEICEKIKNKYPSQAGVLKLPGKTHLPGRKFVPDFIKGRRTGLQNFIINLMNIPEILNFLPVSEFLAINDQRSGLPIYDNETIDKPTNKGKKVENKNASAKITDFDLLKVIGKGTFGKVYLARNNGDFYAIKVLQKEVIVKYNKVKHITAKINDMTHPFLVRLHYSFQTSKDLYFVLDYVKGGALFFHLQREKVFNETRARFYAAEISSALGYLHKLKFIYWDLKIENILLDAKGHIILTDFGLCKEDVKFRHKTTMICGTPECPAPEVLNKQECSYSVDWWCLGVVTYEMMYGLSPFYSEDVAQMHDDIRHKPLQLQPTITPNAQNLLKGLLQKDKDVRLGSGIGGDEDIKAHPFFFEFINWDDLYDKRLQPPFTPREEDTLDLQQFNSEFTEEGIPSLSTDVPSVSIADSTFDVMK